MGGTKKNNSAFEGCDDCGTTKLYAFTSQGIRGGHTGMSMVAPCSILHRSPARTKDQRPDQKIHFSQAYTARKVGTSLLQTWELDYGVVILVINRVKNIALYVDAQLPKILISYAIFSLRV
jgi:hypothetical protein